MDPIAVRILRGGATESVHRASVAVCDGQGRLVASFGDPRFELFSRSTVKPLQTLPVVLSGAAEHFGFGPSELAVISSSHNGEPAHVALVQSILERIGLSEKDLQCGAHAPYYRPEAQRLGDAFGPVHNNCSGKHAGMLATCVREGWDLATYLEPDHPLQQRIRQTIEKIAGLRGEPLKVGVDGCSAPTFLLPLRALARVYARLSRPETMRGEVGRALGRIRDAMIEHPDLVGGTGRLDTEFMREFPGQLLVKAGSEASHGMALLGPGLGVAVKVEDGGSRAVGPILMRVLEDLGVATDREKSALVRHWNEPIKNHAGRVVGGIACDLHLRKRPVPAPSRSVVA